MKPNDLEKLITNFYQTDPAKTSLDIYAFKSEHRTKVLYEYGKFVKNFEDFFEEINFLIQYLNYAEKKSWTQSKGYQYLVLPETIKTLHCAFEIAIDGYYDETIILIRCVFENFLRLVFLSKYPDNIEGIIVSKKRKGLIQFNATHVVEHILKLDSSWLYSLMSSITHGKKPKMLRELTARSTGKQSAIILEYQSDKDSIASCINLFMLMQHLILRSMMVIFSSEIQTTNQLQPRLERIKSADTILELIQTTNSNAHFRTYVNKLMKNAAIIFANSK